VRHLRQPEVGAQLGEVVEKLGDAPVVGPEKRLECEDGEQLLLREILATARRRVRRQSLLGQLQSLAG